MKIDFESLDFDQARHVKQSLEGLFDSVGWEFVEQFIRQRTELREKELYEMVPHSIEQMVSFARVKGGIEELTALPVYLKQMLSEVTEELRRLQDEAEEELATEEIGNDWTD